MTVSGEGPGLAPDTTEQLVVVHDRGSGLGAAIAIDDGTLGPAIGGIRWRAYPGEAAAITEARRLARIMTLKSALAGIASGGAKAVVFRPAPEPPGPTRHAVMEAFGRSVARLGDRYVPGLDMGTNLDDLRILATRAPRICVLEPSEATAIGLFAGIEAVARLRWPAGLDGRTVLVQGVGHVGSSLAQKLAEARAVVLVSDVEPDRARRVASVVGGAVVSPDRVIGHPCDVFSPCAVGQLIDAETAGLLDCEVIAGAANDVLSHRGAAEQLEARGIDYVPDFAINSGGVIAIFAARSGWDEPRTTAALQGIGQRVQEIFETARATDRTPLSIAEDGASARLGHRVTVPD